MQAVETSAAPYPLWVFSNGSALSLGWVPQESTLVASLFFVHITLVCETGLFVKTGQDRVIICWWNLRVTLLELDSIVFCQYVRGKCAVYTCVPYPLFGSGFWFGSAGRSDFGDRQV